MINDCFIALGSNLGDRKRNIIEAIKRIENELGQILKVSKLYQSPAVLKQKAPLDWNKPFLNGALSLKTHLNAFECLKMIHEIENTFSKRALTQWAPREIDIDILLFNDETIESDTLNIPHAKMLDRAFVLSPLMDCLDSKNSYFSMVKEHESKNKLTRFFDIKNISPESFSDGEQGSEKNTIDYCEYLEDNHIYCCDVGAQSTRPGGDEIAFKQEVQRYEFF